MATGPGDARIERVCAKLGLACRALAGLEQSVGE